MPQEEEEEVVKLKCTSQNNGSFHEIATHKSQSSQNQVPFHSKFVARNSYLSHLAHQTSIMDCKARNIPHITEDGKEFATTPKDKHAKGKQMATESNEDMNIEKIKKKLLKNNAELNKEEVVYEQVLNSINVLIDIERKRKKSEQDLQGHHDSGVEESSCLKPSVFRKFDSKPGVRNAEWNTKLRKLKAYNECHRSNHNGVQASSVSDKIATFSKLATKAVVSKKGKDSSTASSTTNTSNKTANTHPSDKSASQKSNGKSDQVLSPFTPATFSSPFLPSNADSNKPKDSPDEVEEPSCNGNISPEFEVNRRLINSSVECLLDPSKVKVDAIASDNIRFLKKLTTSSSSSSFSSIEDLFKLVAQNDGREGLLKGDKEGKVLKESPEVIDLLPVVDTKALQCLGRRKKAWRRENRAYSDSKLKRDSWKEYQLRQLPLCESVQNVATGGLEEENREGTTPRLSEEQEELERTSSMNNLNFTSSTLPSLHSGLFPSETECGPSASLSSSAQKWLDGLESKAVQEGARLKAWTSEYYRTTWIASSNTSLGLTDDAFLTASVLDNKKLLDSDTTLSDTRWAGKEGSTTVDFCCEGPTKPLCDLLTSLPHSDQKRSHDNHHDDDYRLLDDAHCEGEQEPRRKVSHDDEETFESEV